MSGDEYSPMDQVDGDAVVQMSREDSIVRKASSAGLEARVGTLPTAGNRLSSQSTKPLVPTGHKQAADSGGSRRASNSSIGKSGAPSGGDDVPHLPNIGSGRSTPSGPPVAAASPVAPPAKPRGIPKPGASSPGQMGSETTTGASPVAPSSSARASDRKYSPGGQGRIPRSDGSPYAPEAGRTAAAANGTDGRLGRGDAGSGTRSPRGVSPGRDPREAGWNNSAPKGAGEAGAAQRRDLKVAGPSEDERRKRAEWVREKRRREEAKAREEAERREAEESKRREEEQARLEARRAAIRDRIQKQHEVAAKLAQERAKADEVARGAIGRFLAAKPLHQRLKEDYEKQQAELEAEKKRQYDEDARSRHVRPHQIISGEVQVKPVAKPEGSSSPGVSDRANANRSPGHSRGSAGAASSGSGSARASGGPDASAGRGRVSTRAPRPAADLRPAVPRPTAAAASPVAGPSPRSSSPKGVAPASVVRVGSAGKASTSSAASGNTAVPQAPKPRVQGPTLTSTSSKNSRRVNNRLGSLAAKGRLVDRASSPFIFNEAGLPLNVPQPTHVAANGGQVFEVDTAARPPLPPPPPPPPPAESSRELSGDTDGSVLAALAVTAAGTTTIAVQGTGARTTALYDSFDDAPQMQSPLTIASNGVAASAGEAEPRQQDTWGSDAADSDTEAEAETPVAAAVPAGKGQPSDAKRVMKAADDEEEDDEEEEDEEEEDEEEEDDWEDDASTPGAAKTPTEQAAGPRPVPEADGSGASKDAEEQQLPEQPRQQDSEEQKGGTDQPTAGKAQEDVAEADFGADGADPVKLAEPSASTEAELAEPAEPMEAARSKPAEVEPDETEETEAAMSQKQQELDEDKYVDDANVRPDVEAAGDAVIPQAAEAAGEDDQPEPAAVDDKAELTDVEPRAGAMDEDVPSPPPPPPEEAAEEATEGADNMERPPEVSASVADEEERVDAAAASAPEAIEREDGMSGFADDVDVDGKADSGLEQSAEDDAPKEAQRDGKDGGGTPDDKVGGGEPEGKDGHGEDEFKDGGERSGQVSGEPAGTVLDDDKDEGRKGSQGGGEEAVANAEDIKGADGGELSV